MKQNKVVSYQASRPSNYLTRYRKTHHSSKGTFGKIKHIGIDFIKDSESRYGIFRQAFQCFQIFYAVNNKFLLKRDDKDKQRQRRTKNSCDETKKSLVIKILNLNCESLAHQA